MLIFISQWCGRHCMKRSMNDQGSETEIEKENYKRNAFARF